MIDYKRTRRKYSVGIQSHVKPSYVCFKAYDSRTKLRNGQRYEINWDMQNDILVE